MLNQRVFPSSEQAMLPPHDKRVPLAQAHNRLNQHEDGSIDENLDDNIDPSLCSSSSMHNNGLILKHSVPRGPLRARLGFENDKRG